MVNINKLKLTLLQQRIMSYLFEKAGKSFNARALAKNLNVSPPAIAKALPNLEKENLITIEKDKESGRLSIELNKDNQNVIDMKRVENLKTIYESGLVKFLKDSLPGTTIILFGSYSRGDDFYLDEEHKSDIDIAIIGTKDRKIELTEFNKILGKTVIINFYSSFKKIHKHLRDSILSGILLSGSIDL